MSFSMLCMFFILKKISSAFFVILPCVFKPLSLSDPKYKAFKPTSQLAHELGNDIVEKKEKKNTIKVKWIGQSISPNPQVGLRIKPRVQWLLTLSPHNLHVL